MTDIQDTEVNEIVTFPFFITKMVGLTKDEIKSLGWPGYVSSEVNAYLSVFLPISKEGVIGIKYKHPVREMYESGPEYDTAKAEGVEVRLVFNFEDIIDMPTEKKE